MFGFHKEKMSSTPLFLFLSGVNVRAFFTLFSISIIRAVYVIFSASNEQIEISVWLKTILKRSLCRYAITIKRVLFSLIGNKHLVWRKVFCLKGKIFLATAHSQAKTKQACYCRFSAAFSHELFLIIHWSRIVIRYTVLQKKTRLQVSNACL